MSERKRRNLSQLKRHMKIKNNELSARTPTLKPLGCKRFLPALYPLVVQIFVFFPVSILYCTCVHTMQSFG
jgi:hypothetical protein